MIALERLANRCFLDRLDHHLQEVVRGAAVAFVLKVLAVGVAFAVNVALARCLGAESTGQFFLALTVTLVAAELGRVGLDNSLVRFTAASAAVQDWSAIKGLYAKGVRLSCAASALVAMVVFILAPWLAGVVFCQPDLTGLIRWMSLAIVPGALYVLHAQLQKGLKRIRDFIFVLSLWQPAILLVGIIVVAPHWGVQGVAWAYLGASLTTLGIGVRCWRRATPQLTNSKGAFSTGDLLHSATPLFWMSVLHMFTLWSSTMMLGMFATTTEVALFGVANRSANLVSFFLLAVNSIAAPKFAALYRKNEMAEMGRIARDAAKLITIMAAPVFLLLLLAPGWVVSLFGPEFSEAAAILPILAIGQYVNVVTGSVGHLLMMCGYERLMRNNLAICAVISVVGNFLLIPRFGAMGAAIATAVTLSAQNIIGVALVWWRLGIITLPSFRLGHARLPRSGVKPREERAANETRGKDQ